MFPALTSYARNIMAAKQIRTILVGVASPEERSQPAIDRAATLAQALRAQLILFHAAFEPYLSGRPFFDSARLAKSRGELVAARLGLLEKYRSQLEKRGIKARCAVVWEEPAYAAVLRAAIRDDADLIVIGTHRPRANRTPVLRQNDWELMRYSARPLLIVRNKPSKSEGPVVVALDPTHANDKPAALDIELAQSAQTLAAGLDASVHIAHCIPDSAYPLGPISAKARQTAKRDARERLARLLDRAGVDAQKVHVLDGLVEIALPELVAKLGARTLVLGALSRRWLEGFVFGNTAERLIYETSCDLLIVKPPGFSAKLPRARRQAITLPSTRRRSRS
jgi:universal stress protein E